MFKTMLGLAAEGLWRKRKQTLLVVAILAISFTLAVMLLSYTSSISATNSAYRDSIYGSWYGYIRGGQDGDEEFFSETEWLDSLGSTVNCGTVSGYGIGTVDDNFAGMGLILDEGRLPESSGEIAMEESLLSSLGLGYELGQKVSFMIEVQVGAESTLVVKSYTLVGIIRTYTNLWNVSGITLNSAIVTAEDAEDIWSTATRTLGGSSYEPETAYFFTVKSGYDGDSAVAEVNNYLQETRTTSTTSYIKVTVNSAANSKSQSESDTMSVYVIVIFVVTILAVVIINILTMQPEVNKTVRLRSLGATRSQLLLLTVIESAFMAIPALIMGIVFGSVGTWLLLKISMFSGSVSIIVSIPFKKLITAIVLWIFGTIAVKLMTFAVALSTPLTGRMAMSIRKRKFYTRFQKTLIVVMSIVLCFSVLYVGLNVQEPLFHYRYFSSEASYYINVSDAGASDGKEYISDEDIATLSEVPGVSKILGSTQAYVNLTMEGVDTKWVEMYTVDSTADWSALDFSGVDLEAFENGDVVMLVFSNSTELPSTLPKSGDSVTLSVSRSSVSIETTVAKSMVYKATGGVGINDGLDIFDASYYVVCSRAFLQKMVDMLPEGFTWKDYITLPFQKGDTVGFTSVAAFTDGTASYLSTDKTMTRVASRLGLNLYHNLRAKYASLSQDYLQTLILLIVSGACIAIVVLIILSSSIKLETQREKKRYGILQALGMSRRQRNRELMRTALVRSVVAVTVGWGGYLVSIVIKNFDSIREEGATVFGVISRYMSNFTTLFIPGWGIALMTIVMFVVVLMICYVSKLGLNKYTLMEMLREDR
ncbi:MAG: ABC transporter permease [Oscillospiraceae bacterium]|nr:ABC transporter permease [Oscillospiraceae bacterium]